MTDTYSNTGTNADYASKMPDISNDADIQKVIQAYHYGDPVNATAGSFSGSWTNPALGVLGKLIYLNDTLTALDSAKIGKSLLTAKGGLIGATAASTPAMLAAGTNGHVLKANSSTSTGLEWYSLDTTHLNLNPSDQTLTGDLTMSKASPRVAINASSGHSYITSSGASGSEAGLLLSTASVLRWGIQKIASGDNLSIIRYNDGGSAAGTPVAIDRSTGLTTLSSLTVSGATTGTTLSMSGTGSFGGKLSTVASGTSAAGLNIPTGTAPSSPVSGDMWTTTDGIYVRIDSTTYPLAIVADGPGGLSADNVTSGILAGQYGGTGVNNSGKTITLGGNLTTSGAYGLTLTLTGATNVTLPTSGTLVNSAVTTLSSLVSIGTISTGVWQGTVVAGQYGGTGVANTGKTITVSGNTTIGSSTHTVAFATSGNTSVTLPTSGTLATLGSPTFTGTPLSTTAAVDTNTTQIATTAYVVGQGYLKSSTASSTYAPLASPTFTGTVTAATLDLTTSATATVATSYFVETGFDGVVRPKTLANVKTEIVTTAAVNSAAATTVGTVTSGTWSASFGAVSGANLTSLTAGNLTGTIPSAVLENSSVYIGTTAVALNRGTGALTLAGITLTSPVLGDATATTLSIGAGTPAGTLDLGTGTAGRSIVWGGSSGNAHYTSIWSATSSAALVIGRGLRGGTSGDIYESSFSGSFARHGFRTDAYGWSWLYEAAASKAVGTAITPSTLMSLSNSGELEVALGVRSKASAAINTRTKSIATATETIVDGLSDAYDPGGCMGSNGFTAPATGLYALSATISYPVSTTGFLSIRKGFTTGSTIIGLDFLETFITASYAYLTTTVYLTSGQQVGLFTLQSSGSAQTVTAEFSVARVG